MKARAIAFAASLLFAPLPALAQDLPSSVVEGKVPFTQTVLATGLDNPWEITWGPDNFLWVTERTAGKIDRIDPKDGSKHMAIQILESQAPGGQDGLLGLALDPGLLKGTGHDYVYAAYTYEDPKGPPDEGVTDKYGPYYRLHAKIVRLSYNTAAHTLGDSVTLIDQLPASTDHNSGRLKYGPDDKLYYTIGDGGHDQLGNWCIPIEAQTLPSAADVASRNWFAYQGKSLRLDLDGSIPGDNPVIDGVRSHIWTYGHRNMQGIDFAPDGTLYASEQGPKTDDEINILLPGRNYGWPHIAGFRDDKAYQYARWADATTPCAQLTFSDLAIDPSVPREDESAWTGTFEPPIATLFTVPSDWNFAVQKCVESYFICWPTVAPASIEAYMPKPGEGIPGWDNSLIVPTLKRGSIYRIPLAADGRTLRGPIERYFQSENRFRDTALTPDMKTIYVATDNGGVGESMDGGVTFKMHDPGAILAFTYSPGGAAPADTNADASSSAEAAPASAGVAPTFTAGQATLGKLDYDMSCAACHGTALTNAMYGPPLAGEGFEGRWFGKSVGALYQYAHDKMPPSHPGTLPAADYAAIIAYVLSVNGMAPGPTPLPTDIGVLNTMTLAR